MLLLRWTCFKKIYLERYTLYLTLMGEWINTDATIYGNLTF